MITNPTAVFALLAAAVALAIILEERTKTFRALGSALVGILLGVVLLVPRGAVLDATSDLERCVCVAVGALLVPFAALAKGHL